jgi:hypothetical protein
MRSKSRREISKWARSAIEFSALLTLVAGLLVLIRVVTVSRGDVETTYLLLRSTDFAAILMSTILLIVPTLALLATFVTEIMFLMQIRRLGDEDRLWNKRIGPRALAFGISLVLTMTFTPAHIGTVAFISVAVAFPLFVVSLTIPFKKWAGRIAEARAWQRSRRTIRMLIPVFFFGAVLMTAAFARPIDLDRPWAPLEAINFRDADAGVYRVVGENDDWLTLVQDEPRSILTVRADEVAERQVCLDEVGSTYELRLLTGWRAGVAQSGYPLCDDMLDYWNETSK